MFCWKKNCERQSLLQFSFSTWSERSGDRTPPKERREAKPTKATLPKAGGGGAVIRPEADPAVGRTPAKAVGRRRESGERTPAKAVGRSVGAEVARAKLGRSERPSGEQANACKGGRLVGASNQTNTSRSDSGEFIHNVDYITRVKPALPLEYN